MSTTDSDLSELPPYTALLWGQFLANPHLMYNLFSRGPNGTSFASDHVINMTGVWTNSKMSEFKVDSLEELQRVRNDLLTMPILFHIKVEHQKTENYAVIKIRKKWKDEFAVLVNTRHPTIREILSHKLNEATQHMQEGKNFCLKLDFGPSVKQWYSGVVDNEVSFCDSRSNSDSGHMEIFVHNYTTPIECCVNPVCIFCCFPFWLLFGGPCYCIHRNIKCTDESHSFSDLPVVLLTGVSVRVRVEPAQQFYSYPSGPGHYPPGPPAMPQGPPAYTPPQGYPAPHQQAPPAGVQQNYPPGAPQNHPVGAPPPYPGHN
ncbi:uncharacterized protein LOC134251224 [Saccostrea cucullata]|uniref:uncharacterized protein LOC134251224 n=1 Tax=Saccostrea cuccullata TaxID=36930 RepID=UPI002ED1ED6D